MHEDTVVALTVVTFAWGVLSRWLGERFITGPLVLTVAGLLLANPSWGVVSVDIDHTTVHHLAEVTLALLLFSDASAVPLAAARQDLPLTARLLGIGLPLSMIAGTAVAVLLFPKMPLALAGLVGASLAPTDAALSAAVIADERLPMRLRRVINVESGLNDGIATPVVTFCIAATASTLGIVTHDYDDGWGAVGELLIGTGVGAGVGLIGGMLIIVTRERGWTQHGARRLATLSLALMAFLVASESGGNPFVAAFVGGLVRLSFGSAPTPMTACARFRN